MIHLTARTFRIQCRMDLYRVFILMFLFFVRSLLDMVSLYFYGHMPIGITRQYELKLY